MSRTLFRKPYDSPLQHSKDSPNPFSNRAAIICTISRKTTDGRPRDILLNMARAGMSIARFNFAKINTASDRKWFLAQCKELRRIEVELRTPIGVMVDLGGPKLRLGALHKDFTEGTGKGTRMVLRKGDRLTLTLARVRYSRAPTMEEKRTIQLLGIKQEMPRWESRENASPILKLGDEDYRRLRLVNRSSDGKSIVCEVVDEELEVHATDGVTFADIDLSAAEQEHVGIESFPRKDLSDLAFILSCRPAIDFISISFASLNLVQRIRHEIDSFVTKAVRDEETASIIRGIWLVAKVETPSVAEGIETLLASPDVNAVMVARGDLAQAITMFRLPETQQLILAKAKTFGKPAIIATGLLQTSHIIGRPTIARSEANDISQVLEMGADALMLSETSHKDLDPVAEITICRQMILKAEATVVSRKQEHELRYCPYRQNAKGRETTSLMRQERDEFVDKCICLPAIRIAEQAHATVIAATVTSGKTICLLARHLPIQLMLALCKKPESARRVLLCRGVFPFLVQGHDIENLHDPQAFHRALMEAIRTLKIDALGVKAVLRDAGYLDAYIQSALKLVGGDWESRESTVVGIMKVEFCDNQTSREPVPNTIHVFKLGDPKGSR